MAIDIILPILGESISNAILVRWFKKTGEEVKRGEILADLETDKATLDLESPANGILQVIVEEGTTVSTGQRLALVTAPEEGLVTAPSSQASPGQPSLPITPVNRFNNAAQVPELDSGRRVSPAARKMAQDLGIDIDLVPPMHTGNRISTDDVKRFVDSHTLNEPGPVSLPSHIVAMNDTRKTTARRMVESAQNIPQFSLTIQVEMDRFKRTLEDIRSSATTGTTKISITALLIYLIGKVIPEHSLINARYDPDGIRVFDTINIAVAMASKRGLVAPVIHHVENLSITELARCLDELIQDSKNESLSLDQVSEGTFTISNLGMYGVTQFIPLINPPQAAILGVGTIQPAIIPLSEGGTRHVHVMNLSLSVDHRVLDGSEAANFLASLKNTIEQCSQNQINI